VSLRAATPADCALLTERTGYTPAPNASGLVAEMAGRIAGMVLFDTWTPNSAHAHVVVEAPAPCRALLRAAFAYAFSHVGVLFGVIRHGNARSLRLAQHAGFRQLAVLQDGWAPGEPLLLLQMRRDECRFLTR
jgi:L-amino acid N-acyltransferase YncA